MRRPRPLAPLLFLHAVALFLAGCQTPAESVKKAVSKESLPSAATPAPPEPPPHPVMLGIDTLEADGFAAIQGKRVGLLTHPAGVNRRGESTIDVLRRAPGVQLVKLFAPEHGLYGLERANERVHDSVDARTGLPVYSLYGDNRRPTAAQLQGLDALLVDLQDIGVRSYTFNVVMRYAMDACFQRGVELIVLDRPNPLGGLKVDGPLLDREFRSGVGAYRIPYVHGLTLGELARYAAGTPGEVDVPEDVRVRGRLQVIPMRGWKRAMRWPDTGLTFAPTSQYVRDFDAVIGYAMVGLGCEYSGFTHGIGTPHPFRLLSFRGRDADTIERDLAALQLPGIAFRKLATRDARNQPATGIFVEVADWEKWNPTELSFHMMRLACRYTPANPFTTLSETQAGLFNKHVGSAAWWAALRRDGARVDVESWRREWQVQAAAYQEATRKFRLYD